MLRFRPILMTTMAALLGGVPMMLGTGVGSEIRQPLGYAIVGGLALSQVLTLYTTPVVYIYLDRLQTWLFGEKRQHASLGRGNAGACRMNIAWIARGTMDGHDLPSKPSDGTLLQQHTVKLRLNPRAL